MRLKLFSIFLLLNFVMSSGYAIDRRDFTDVALKSALASFTVLPFSFSASKLAIGGFANFSSLSAGNYYPKDSKTGYGAFVGYEFTRFEAEAFAKNLHFNSKVDFGSGLADAESKSLVYGAGARIPFWRFVNLKAGYCFHEIKSEAVNNPTIGALNYEDNGFYYGTGIRLVLGPIFSIYSDLTGYTLNNTRNHLVDFEAGLRYAF